jgi:G protein beta subunit-like protein
MYLGLFELIIIQKMLFLFAASSDNMARLWNVESGEVKREYSGHQKAVVCLAFKDDVPE